MTTTYNTRDEAVQREIVDPIMAGDVQDAHAEYDIDAIAAQVIGDYSTGFACKVDTHEFWAIVERHARTTRTATATYTTEGHLSITTAEGSHLAVGTYDADGGEWVPAVDSLLADAGYVRVGDWDGDNAPVRRK